MPEPGTVYRAVDGSAWKAAWSPDGTILRRATQDPGTGQWHTTSPVTIDPTDVQVRTDQELAAWTVIPPEPLRDPRITRLAILLDPVLARLSDEQAAEIHAALADVQALPEEWHRSNSRAYAAGRRGTGRRR